MSGCQYHSRLGAYHDGELDAVSSQVIERHLPGCDDCTRELAGLREVSQAMSHFDPGHITSMEQTRLHRQLDRANDRTLVRFSSVLATMAASVLIISLAWMSQISPRPALMAETERARQIPDWQRLAMGERLPAPALPGVAQPTPPETGVAVGGNNEMIDWMLDGLQGPKVHANR